MPKTTFYILAVVAAGLCGCVPQHVKPMEPEPATQAERNFNALWESSRELLKKYDYEIDRMDKREGIITTYATTGGQFFEVWRKDSGNFFDWRENSVKTMLRAVRITIFRVGDSDRYDFQLEVRMARTDLPNAVLSDTSQTNNIIENGGPAAKVHQVEYYRRKDAFDHLTFEDLSRVPDKSESHDLPAMKTSNAASIIIPMGRDADLEAKMTTRLKDAVETYSPRRAGTWVSF
ncbi:MAG TPA: hypothetical protein PKK48_03405 [Phycisphaerae bacterium]|nr:hypothetical protein [Phycisphaerae bacterium]HPS53718.1 hypothetical protein [Phycisphaerae bacterium]